MKIPKWITEMRKEVESAKDAIEDGISREEATSFFRRLKENSNRLLVIAATVIALALVGWSLFSGETPAKVDPPESPIEEVQHESGN
jgi:hypothetical protein